MNILPGQTLLMDQIDSHKMKRIMSADNIYEQSNNVKKRQAVLPPISLFASISSINQRSIDIYKLPSRCRL